MLANTQHYSEKNNKNSITALDLETLPYAILLYELQQVGRHLQQNTLVVLPACEINPYRSSGDMSGDDISLTTGSQIHQNNRIAAKKKLEVVSTHGPISRTTGKYTVVHHIENGHIVQEVAMPQQVFSCDQGDVEVCAYGDLSATGTHTQAGRHIGEVSQTGDNLKNPLNLPQTVTINIEEDGGLFGSDTYRSETRTTYSCLANTTIAGGNNTKAAGKNISQRASQDVAGKDLGYRAEDNISIVSQMGANSYSSTSTKEGMCNSSTTSSSYETPVVNQAHIQGKNIFVEAHTANLAGVRIEGDKLFNKAKKLTCQSAVKEIQYSQQVTSESPLARSDCGVKGGQEVEVPIQLRVNQIINLLEEGELDLVSADWDRDKTQIIGRFTETTRQLKSWQTSWAHHDQAIPNEALIVVALAVSIATYGTGTTLGSALCGVSTIGAEMVATGFASICSQAATSFLRHGDIIQTGRDVFSGQGLRSLGTAMATAGLVGGGGGDLSALNFSQRLALNGFKSVVRAGVSSVIEQRNIGECLQQGGVTAVVDSISGVLAQKIGQSAFGKTMTPLQHKIAHFGVGASTGAILDRDHPLAGAVSGGLGAVMAEVVAEEMIDRARLQKEVLDDMRQAGETYTPEAYRQAYRQKLRPYIDASRLIVGSVTAALGQDPTVAIYAATTALENNLANSIPMPNIGSLVMAIARGAREIYTTSQLNNLYKEVGVEGVFLKLVEDKIIGVHTSSKGETYYTVYDEYFDTPHKAWEAVAWHYPSYQKIEASERAKGRSLYDTFESEAFRERLHKVSGDIAVHAKTRNSDEKTDKAASTKTRNTQGSSALPPPEQKPEKNDRNDSSKIDKNINYKTSGFQKGDKIDLSRFTQRLARGNLKDPKTGEILSPERSGNPHGGSAWKLFKNAKTLEKNSRSGTFSADGTFLRN